MPNESAKIILAVTNGKLSKVRDSLAIEGTINALQVGFQFRTSDWDNTTKTAVFVRGRAISSTTNADITYVVLDDNNECDVPAEIIANDGMFSVGVFGIKDDYRIVSNWMCYRVTDGCYADGSTPIDPSSTVYEQIISMLNNKSEVSHNHDERYYTKDEIDDKVVATSDWNQNDETATDYIKNRTHYIETNKQLVTSGMWVLTLDGGTDLFIVSKTGLNVESFNIGDIYELICTHNNGNIYKFKLKATQTNEIRARIINSYRKIEQIDPSGADLAIQIVDGSLSINTAAECNYLIGESSVEMYHIQESIHQIESKYLPGVQIIPINQDDIMTAEDFLALNDGLYMIYNAPFDNAYGLVRVSDGCWTCYDCAFYYDTMSIVDGQLTAIDYGPLDGFGYEEADNLLSRIFPIDIQEGQTIIASHNEDGDIIFNASDFPKGITHINTDGNMTAEEFRNLEDGVYIFDKRLTLTGYQNTSTQVYGYVFYYTDSSGNFSADCISTLTHISPYYGTFYIASLIPSDIVNDTELNNILEEVLV